MKNLYYLDNYERDRILNLHQHKTRLQYLSESISKLDSFIWGVSDDDKVLFTENKLYVIENDKIKSLDYNLESLPYLLNITKMDYDKKLIEGSINLIEYISIPRKFLSEILQNNVVNLGEKILKEWDEKFYNHFNLLNENVAFITEDTKIKQLWEEVSVICERTWAEWGQQKLQAAKKGLYNVGKAIGSGAMALGSTVLKGISSTAQTIVLPILKKGILTALRWIRRNINSYIGIIGEIILSMFPTVVIVKAVWGLIVMLDIYEILKNDFDPLDPDRRNAPFMGLITDLISLFTTSAVGATSKAIFKTAATKAAKGEAIPTTAKNFLKTITSGLPTISSAINYVSNIVKKIFGETAAGYVNYVLNGLKGVVDRLLSWVKTTFKFNEFGSAIVQTAKQIPTKVGIQKIITGALLGGGLQYLTGDRILKKGDTNDFVKQAQQLVIQSKSHTPEIKYDGPVNGTFDVPLENAIKQIQKLTNLPVTGTIDSKMGMMLGIDYGPGTLEKLTGNIPFANAAIKNISNGFGIALMGANNFIESNLASFKGALAGNTQNKKT